MFFSSLSFLEQTCILTGILGLVTKLDLRLTNLKRQELLTRYDGYSFFRVARCVSGCITVPLWRQLPHLIPDEVNPTLLNDHAYQQKLFPP